MSNLRWSAYFLAGITALAWGAAAVWHPAPPPRYTGLADVRPRIPAMLDNYQSSGEDPIDPVVRQALGAADMYLRSYRDSAGHSVSLALIGGTDRSALHDPRSCLVGAGWRIEDDHTETIPGTRVTARTCRIVGGPDGTAYEVVYLYVVDGQIVNQVTQIRSQMLLSALVGKRNRPVCFVRFMRPLSSSGAQDTQDRAPFLKFTSDMWNLLELDKQVPDRGMI